MALDRVCGRPEHRQQGQTKEVTGLNFVYLQKSSVSAIHYYSVYKMIQWIFLTSQFQYYTFFLNSYSMLDFSIYVGAFHI